MKTKKRERDREGEDLWCSEEMALELALQCLYPLLAGTRQRRIRGRWPRSETEWKNKEVYERISLFLQMWAWREVW